MEISRVQELSFLEEKFNLYFLKDTLTNNYILAKDYQHYIDEGKLWFAKQGSNFYLFLQKEDFFRLYYMVNDTNSKEELDFKENIVLEILYRGEKNFPQKHIDFFYKNGFVNHLTRDCYFLKAEKVNNLIDNKGNVEIKKVNTPELIEFAKNLMDQNLDLYTGDYLTFSELQNFANQGFLYCSFMDGKPSGMLQAEFKNNTFWLGHIVVHKDFRGKGLANHLVEFYLQEGIKNKANQFQLWVIKDNEPAVNLYKKKGFVYLNKSSHSMLKLK